MIVNALSSKHAGCVQVPGCCLELGAHSVWSVGVGWDCVCGARVSGWWYLFE